MQTTFFCPRKPKYTVIMVLTAVALLFLALVFSMPARAAGLLIADGGFGGVLETKEHDVNVTINNGIAVTEVTQIFHNTENRQVEALYTFPVPKHASVSNFSMWIGGKEMVGEVLDKERPGDLQQLQAAAQRPWSSGTGELQAL